MDPTEVQRRVEAALARFLEQDVYLLEHNLHEQCISARVALHLQGLFPEYSVDVEYNRAGDIPKRLGLPDECANSFDEEGRALVVPDIIVHRRGTEGPNVLGLELKKTSDPRGSECDRLRIKALKEHLGYEHGALLVCETRQAHEHTIRVLKWI